MWDGKDMKKLDHKAAVAMMQRVDFLTTIEEKEMYVAALLSAQKWADNQKR